MDKYRYLRSIANSIYAAEKIRILLNNLKTGKQDDRDVRATELGDDKVFVLCEAANIISDYLPVKDSRYGNDVKELINKSTEWGNTYSQLKQRVSLSRSSPSKQVKLIETLSLVRPLLRNESRNTIDKFLKIYAIIKD